MEEEKKKKKREADTEKESKYTHSKDIERTQKERHRQRKQHKAEEKFATQVCIWDFTSPFRLYISLSLHHSQIIIFVW